MIVPVRSPRRRRVVVGLVAAAVVLAGCGTRLDHNAVVAASSGIGGGALLLYWDARERALHAYDGRETAPAGATPALFLDDKGAPMPFPIAVVGGRSVGVPGVLRMPASVVGEGRS